MFPHLFVFLANRNISHTLKSGVHGKLPNHVHGANSGNRTRTFCLEGRCSTIKLYRRIGGTHGYNRQRVLKGMFMRYKKINRKENYSMKRKQISMCPFWLGWNDLNVRKSAGVKTLCLTAWLHPNDYTIFVWCNYIIVPYLLEVNIQSTSFSIVSHQFVEFASNSVIP